MPTILRIGPYTLTLEAEPEIEDVQVTDEALIVELTDGRILNVPLHWYPRLQHALPHERENWKVMGEGYGIEWSDVDEQISLVALLAGRKSSESQHSLNRWLASRQTTQESRHEQDDEKPSDAVDDGQEASAPIVQTTETERELVVVLEPDIVQVFQTPEQVKDILRALIDHMPATPPQDA